MYEEIRKKFSFVTIESFEDLYRLHIQLQNTNTEIRVGSRLCCRHKANLDNIATNVVVTNLRPSFLDFDIEVKECDMFGKVKKFARALGLRKPWYNNSEPIYVACNDQIKYAFGIMIKDHGPVITNLNSNYLKFDIIPCQRKWTDISGCTYKIVKGTVLKSKALKKGEEYIVELFTKEKIVLRSLSDIGKVETYPGKEFGSILQRMYVNYTYE